ncbi:hypothetical protein [Dermacoccus nishinomiyaensis]|uniref:hypothetical protein n=1 Tax=Dermacoccus nishinomiyaensis TaxID=1274 RepID=UPI0011C07F25|nr:hypothetical protein [Dermacoccus nishinomiyaensis]
MTRASISPDGDVAANSVTVADDVSIAGADLIGQRLPYAGSSGASWLDTLPWALAGISNMGKTVAGRAVTAQTTEVITPLHVVTATVWPGRTYQVTMPYAYYVTRLRRARLLVCASTRRLARKRRRRLRRRRRRRRPCTA